MAREGTCPIGMDTDGGTSGESGIVCARVLPSGLVGATTFPVASSLDVWADNDDYPMYLVGEAGYIADAPPVNFKSRRKIAADECLAFFRAQSSSTHLPDNASYQIEGRALFSEGTA